MESKQEAPTLRAIIWVLLGIGLIGGAAVSVGGEVARAGIAWAYTWARSSPPETGQHAQAVLKVLAHAVKEHGVPVDVVHLGRVDQRIDGRHYVATGRLIGSPDVFVKRDWRFVAHLQRLCDRPEPVCWQLDSMVADYHMIYPSDGPSPSTYLRWRSSR